MADPSDTAGCGDSQVQQAQTVITDTPAEIIHIVEDVLKAATDKLVADVTGIEFKIHRFPAKLRGFGRDMDYIAPSIVAIGPYYHGVPELQAMEEVKRMAVYYFCEGLADSPEEVYKKILPVAREVRGRYADVDALEGITDDDFAAMMFFDGCFLVQCMDILFSGEQSPFTSVIRSKGRGSILRDMLLLENQIPWPVLKLLTGLRPAVRMVHFIGLVISGFRVSWCLGQQGVNIYERFEPPHLLGLIHFHQVGSRKSVPEGSGPEELVRKKSVPVESGPKKSAPVGSGPEESGPEESVPVESVPEESGPKESVLTESVPEESGTEDFVLLDFLQASILPARKASMAYQKKRKEKIIASLETSSLPARKAFFSRKKEKGVDELTVTTSAAELMEIGVKLKPSGTTQFSDMKVVRELLCATLSLAPLLLNDINACWLVNMAAFEQCTAGLGKAGYPINSYLSVMAQLMNQDDDVRELRGKRIMHTTFDYRQTLKFFKCLASHLTEDSSYFDLLEGLEEYKQKRWVWIAIYKFLYNNAKTIATVLSIVGVLVGIFKTLPSLKQHQP